MKNCKCADCAYYINQWCRKVKDSPYPDLIRDCDYFHDIETNVEKIIRCRECKHAVHNEFYDSWYCLRHNVVAPITENGFCAWAEKKEEE